MMHGRINTGRAGALLALAIGVAAAWHWRHFFDPFALADAIRHHPAAPVAFIALHICASLFFVPRTLMAVAAGVVFGMWWGIVWAAIGSVAGAVAGFAAARYIAPGLGRRAEAARLGMLLAQVERGGWRVVALVRLVPVIPHSLTNYALGLTRMPLGAYALGSLLGQMPLTVAYADLGAAGGRALLSGAGWQRDVLWPTIIGLAALGGSMLVPMLMRRGRTVPPI